MSSRYGYLALLSLGLACQLGCCGWNWGPAGSPCERTWCGSQCGCRVWSEWFSFPPMCRDNCSCCGDFTASNNPYVLNGPSEARFGPIYDDGGPRATARIVRAEPRVDGADARHAAGTRSACRRANR